MRLIAILAGIGVSVAVLFAVYVRLAPSDAKVWHVDPRAVQVPSLGRYILRDAPQEADGPAPRFVGTREAVMQRFHAVALAAPRVQVLAGSPDEGHVTYVARSRVFGFPDYISVLAYDDGGSTALAIYGRLRFGQSDLGVNKARISAWLDAMAVAPS